MYYKLVALDDKEEEKRLDEVYGRYNDEFPAMRELTHTEFARSMYFSYTPEYIGYRQFIFEGLWCSFYYYIYFDGSGVAFLNDCTKPRFFYFTNCEHKYRELSMRECALKNIYHGGNCYHVRKCEECGFVNAYDSSG